MKNPYNQDDKKLNNKQSLNEKDENRYCYAKTPGNINLKSTINTSINNKNPYNQNPLPEEGKVIANENKNTQYFINTPDQEQENKKKNEYQPNPFLKDKSVKNNESISFNLFSDNQDNHINSASNIDFENRQNKNDSRFEEPLKNYSIDE